MLEVRRCCILLYWPLAHNCFQCCAVIFIPGYVIYIFYSHFVLVFEIFLLHYIVDLSVLPVHQSIILS